MRKKYLRDDYGTDASYWDKNWNGPFPDAPQVDAKLVRCMERYLKDGSKILEGGCGNANYLRYFHDKGYAVTGVDFAQDTVARIKASYPHLDVAIGNILALAFPDGTFDAYYSGGVIEHFEEGVDAPLREAARVLKFGGCLFLTVPHMNVARKWSSLLSKEKHITDLDGRSAYLRDRVRTFRSEPPPAGYHFHEYELDTKEMRSHLQRQGFRIVEEAAFSTFWGIRDLQPYQRAAGIGKDRPSLCNRIARRVARQTQYIDDSSGAVSSALSAAQSALFGNLKLYVCVKGARGSGSTAE